MRNIVVLAAGPPKPNRNRHLENRRNGKPIIDNILEESKKCCLPIFVVVNSENKELIEHLNKNHERVKLLLCEEPNNSIYDTFKAALSIPGDCIMVCGDLLNIRDIDIRKFALSDYKSAICKYGVKWGNNLVSKTGLIRRSDIGDCISMISEDQKANFLSEKNYESAIKYFQDFYPQKSINFQVYNDIGTHMMYSFFEEIWANPKIDSTDNKGAIFFEHIIYEDND